MLNNSAYDAERRETKAQVIAGPQAWRKTIGQRYGEFLLAQLLRQENKLKNDVARWASEPSEEKRSSWIAREQARINAARLEAEAYVSGAKIVNVPVEVEVTLRLAEEYADPL